MASLSTCHLELVVWDGNLVKSLVKSCILVFICLGIIIIIMVMRYIFFLMFRNIQYHASIILYSISRKTDSRLRGEGAFVDIFSGWLF